MPTDDVRAEAIEAAAEAIRCLDGPATIGGTPAATAAVDAAIPRLLAPIRALHQPVVIQGTTVCTSCDGLRWPCDTTEALDALERGGSDA